MKNKKKFWVLIHAFLMENIVYNTCMTSLHQPIYPQELLKEEEKWNIFHRG